MRKEIPFIIYYFKAKKPRYDRENIGSDLMKFTMKSFLEKLILKFLQRLKYLRYYKSILTLANKSRKENSILKGPDLVIQN